MTKEERGKLTEMGDLVRSRIAFSVKEIGFIDRLQGYGDDCVLSKAQKAWLYKLHNRWYYGNKALQQGREVHADLNPDYTDYHEV